MLTFFRRIRKSFLTAGKTQSYVLYALGEILLVMVGILLALQVNNWNNDRVDKRQEVQIEQNLHREFVQNKTALDGNLEILERCIKASYDLMELFGKEEHILRSYNLDSMIFMSIEFEDYSPSQNVFSDLIQSGRLSLLRNQNLRDQLFEWSRVIGLKEIEYATVQEWVSTALLPYFVENISIKNIDYYSNSKWHKPTVLPNDNVHIFADLIFENLVDNWIYDLLKLKKELIKLGVVIDTIIDETEDNGTLK